MMANKVEEFPIFTSLDKITVKNMLQRIASYLYNISDTIKIDPKKIETSMDIMYEIIERIEKRRIYFHIYYAFRFRDLSKESIMILAESLIN